MVVTDVRGFSQIVPEGRERYVCELMVQRVPEAIARLYLGDRIERFSVNYND